MPADNSIYEWLDDWWDPTGSVAGIHAMNPARAAYFLGVLESRFGPDLSGLPVLDVGCGGGILTEELLRRSVRAIGADLAEGALAQATAHARSGGLFLYDTINRTWLTLLFHVGILQEWRKLVPPCTHDWHQFVKPGELERAMRAEGLRPVETRGLLPAQPVRFALHLLKHEKGRHRMPPFRIGKGVAGSYLGYATK